MSCVWWLRGAPISPLPALSVCAKGSTMRAERGKPAPSIDIRLVAAGGFQLGDKAAGGGVAHLADLGRNLGERAFHVPGHALGVATDVEMRALLEPGP